MSSIFFCGFYVANIKNIFYLCALLKRVYNIIVHMANHKSSLKRIRQSEKRRLENKYYARTTRNAIKKLRHTTDKNAAMEQYPAVASMLDKLAKKNVIHKNKASNLKSRLALYIDTLN